MDDVTEQEPQYRVNYRDIKYPRLEYKTGKLFLILPKNQRDEKDILQRHSTWIQKKEAVIQKALEESRKLDLSSRSITDLKNYIHTTKAKNQTELGIEVSRILFKAMKTKWASYSPNHNITVNTLMRHLPENLIDYIIYHEMAHGIEKKHNDQFWAIISKKYPNHSTIERELFSYWFLIQKIEAPLTK